VQKPLLALTDLHKEYRLYDKPHHRLHEILFGGRRHSVFTALSGVNLTIGKGEAVGVIGDNGAGKSTLLKLIAGTVAPTGGKIVKNGTLSALLELGAGFSQELTGRQNIYLNAALLGMDDHEIARHEQEIIEFSELDEFIDRPVKNYSSGMYVRLGFSIAISVDPELLIVDEALSVGDLHFQKKCIDRVMAKKNAGMSILFCSHSLYQVQEVCERSIWINHGKVVIEGETNEVITCYSSHVKALDNGTSAENAVENGNPADGAAVGGVMISSIEVRDAAGNRIDSFCTGDDLEMVFSVVNDSGRELSGHVAMGLVFPNEQVVMASSTKKLDMQPVSFTGRQKISGIFRDVPICSGIYKPKVILLDDTGLMALAEASGEEITCLDDRPEFGNVFARCDWNVAGSGS